MKAATILEIKEELKNTPSGKLIELCLRLARFKTENKELLTYLLFEESNEQQFVEAIKQDINKSFTEINYSNLYFAKKSLRKILRQINKFSRYSGSKQTAVELLLHFCVTFYQSDIPFNKSPVLVKLYESQLVKINKLIGSLHEDLQYDFLKIMKTIPSKST